MQNKTVIITGASDGIGAVAARKLHELGATVVVVGRSPEKTKQVADEIGAAYFTADFAKLDDVRKLAAQLKAAYSTIDVLINNAGGVFGTRTLTIDGHEKTLQVNHLAPFLLTNLLMDTLVKSKAIIINTSSIANTVFARFDIDDLELENGYSANRAYGNAKLANILFTRELHRRHYDDGVRTVAVHPGNVATNFANDASSLFKFVYHTPLAKLLLESPEKGAEPLVWCATTKPDTDWVSGEFYQKHKVGKVNAVASTPGIAEKLWDISAEYTLL